MFASSATIAQILGFAINASVSFAWYRPAVDWLQLFINPFGLSQLADGSGSVILTYLSLGTVFLLLGDAGFVFYMFIQNKFKQFWTLRLLRLISSASHWLNTLSFGPPVCDFCRTRPSSHSTQFSSLDLCILSLLADLVCGPFFIPIINVFTLRLPCMVAGSVCYSPANAVLAVIGLVAGLLYIVLCLLLSATYFTRYDLFAC